MHHGDPHPIGDVLGPLTTDVAARLLEALSDDDTGEFDALIDPDLPRIGEYLINRRIGQGGGGVVYHAVRPDWNDEFAIKLLHRAIGEGASSRRVWRELDLIEGLDLPATPRVYEYGLHQGRLYIVSQHIDGLSLDQACAGRSVAQRARVLARVARAVAQLHRYGVIHRDIKPSNILVDDDDNAYLIDLGIAAPLDRHADDDITLDGAPIGSIAYMAPEQARGERENIGVPADIYGLGATACLILTGQTPHQLAGTQLGMLRDVAETPHRPIRQLAPDLDRDLAAILETSLARSPDDRYNDADAFADDIERWLDGRPVQCRPTPWWRRALMAVRRRPAMWGWSTAAALAIIALGIFGVDRAVQAHINQQVEQRVHAAVTDASRQFVDLMEDERFGLAVKHVETIEIYAREELWPEDEPLPDLEARRDQLAAAMLQVVYDAPRLELSQSQLAFEALDSLFRDSPGWNDDTKLRLIHLLAEIDQ